MLGDLGARVIKVESPNGDRLRWATPSKGDFSAAFTQFNSGKQSVCINYRTKPGVELIAQLAAKCDVFLENFRAGLLPAIGLGYDDLKLINPGIVYCSISGFGQVGPNAGRPAYTDIIQALSGLDYAAQKMQGNETDSPPGYPASLADTCASQNAAISILAALYHRAMTGEGQYIDVSMLDSLIAANDSTLQRTIFSGGDLDRPSDIFRAPFKLKDGYMAASVGLNFDKTVSAIGRPELVNYERFNLDVLQGDNMAAYIKIVRAWAIEQTVEQASAVFDEYDIPYGKVNSSSDVINSQIVQDREMKVDITLPGGVQTSVINTPFTFSSGKSRPQGPPPKLGEHNDIVLSDLLGLSNEDRQSLYNEGILVSDNNELFNNNELSNKS
jgi:crotonobetainyl-CoA:carnitine CoA-transferase CaiB-like acyl-CoA transferase